MIKLACLCGLLLFGCDSLLLGEQGSSVGLDENLLTPAETEDGWVVSGLDAEGIQAELVRDLVRQIQDYPRNLHSFLIVRNGKLVLESYFGGWERERMHELRSCSKSVNSLLVGIAIDQGALDGVEHAVFDLFPQYAGFADPSKAGMRVEHLLTMSSGLGWSQAGYENEDRNDERALERSDDWLGYVLSREMKDPPGAVFLYNSGCSALLAGIVKQTTGQHSDVLAERYLFGPLGIERYYWHEQEDGLCNAWAGLSLRPRDMAKIGQLMLDGGRWEGQQIVSQHWVERSTMALQSSGEQGYGYQWWTAEVNVNGRPIRVNSAQGNGGQYIFMMPELNAVVVFTGGNYYPLDQSAPYRYMKEVVLPSML